MPDPSNPKSIAVPHRTGVALLRATGLVTDPRAQRFARWLSEEGFEIVNVGWDRLGDIPAAAVDVSTVLARIPATYGGGLRLAGPLLLWQMFLLKWLIRNRKRYQVVQAADLDTALPALLVATLLDKKLVYDIHDYYIASHAVPSCLRFALKWLEDFVIKRADATIIVCESRKVQLKDTSPRRLEVIPNVPECKETNGPLARRSSEFRLVYVGLLVECRGLLEICGVMRRHPEWRFDVAGSGPAEAAIRGFATESHNIRFHGRLSYADTLALTATADSLIATYDPQVPNHRHSSPNKLGEALLFGRPIIVAANTGVDAVVAKHQIGFVVPYGDDQALEYEFTKIAGWTPAERERYASHVRRVYEEHFGTYQVKRRFSSLYDAVLKGIDAEETTGHETEPSDCAERR